MMVSLFVVGLCSLLMWRHEASRRLYLMLWLALPLTLLVPAAQLSSWLGFYFLAKLFVVDFLFLKFPRLRAKYDTSALMWDDLPTDADLDAREKLNGKVKPPRSIIEHVTHTPPQIFIRISSNNFIKDENTFYRSGPLENFFIASHPIVKGTRLVFFSLFPRRIGAAPSGN